MLDEINELLKNETSIPDYRRTVSKAGKNIAWLKKHLKSPTSKRLEYLLSLPISTITS